MNKTVVASVLRVDFGLDVDGRTWLRSDLEERDGAEVEVGRRE
jgi:hypothetical protein